MNPLFFVFGIFALLGLSHCDNDTDHSPQQVHLSYTGQLDSMFVTWATLTDVEGNGSVTFWASSGGENSSVTVDASKTKLSHEKDDGAYRYTWIFRATMQPLEPDTVYEYSVQSGDRKSDSFTFKTFSDSDSFKPKFAIYGDFGIENHVSMFKLIQYLNASEYQMVLHIGDFAYDMNEKNGVQGDVFMDMIQPVASRVPYNVAVGNHEEFNNFTEYSGRFTSPGPSVFYNSFDVGPIHFVLFSSEFYFYTNYGLGQLQAQYNWLVDDLAKANTEQARNEHPWIVAMAHRPMYCSSHDGDDCTKHDSIMRTGYEHELYKLEDLFFKNGVDLQFYAHEHDYERLYPIYDYTYQKVKNASMYMDPRYPVHVVTGAAGCREDHDPFTIPKPKWSFFRSNNYGFTLMGVEDKLTLKIRQFSVVKDEIIDEFMISKSDVFPNFDWDH